MRWLRAALWAAAAVAAVAVHAQAQAQDAAPADGRRSTQTGMSLPMASALGVELRPEVAGLVNLVRMRQIEEAARQGPGICARYEALFQPGQRHLSFADETERAAWAARDARPFVWVDFSYSLCLKALLFIAVDRGRDGAALELAQRIAEVSPLSAGAVAELGFLLSRQGRFEESLAAYRRAREMATQYEAQRPVLPLVLRGIGAALIDLNRLDEAEAAYRESLALDPASPVAKHQLEHIAQKRQR